MSDTAITVEKLGKRYRLGMGATTDRTLREVIMDGLGGFVGRSAAVGSNGAGDGLRDEDRDSRFLWALRDVSFEVRQGEVVGIIGRNGAGKSTLLKILSRITDPTEGRATIFGRVGSLLEVGTGFHPELSGRENIFLNGAILGMSRGEIRREFDEIVDFAEIERFMDTPVKRYSSGMYVRLAFAVAAHLNPEILMVDEVLAVGDAAFQKKCLGKMGEIATQGRTVLFVSHNMGAVHTLTHRCLYLKGGRIVAYEATDATVRRYLSEAAGETGAAKVEDVGAYRRDRLGDAPIHITGLWAESDSGARAPIEIGAPFSVNIEVEAQSEIRGANADLILYDADARRVVVFFSGDQHFGLFLQRGRHLIRLTVDELPLAPGRYFADVGINQSTETKAYDVLLKVPLLTIVNTGRVVQWLERPWGSVHWEKLGWSTAALGPVSKGALSDPAEASEGNGGEPTS